jgi:hypothetical protein
MSRKQFSIHYPDGSKEHVGRVERDKLLLSGILKPITSTAYHFTGQRMTLHAMSDLGQLRIAPQGRSEPDYYPGKFIWEFKQRRFSECMESSEAQILRLTQQNVLQVQT